MHRQSIKQTPRNEDFRQRIKSLCMDKIKSSREAAMMKRRGIGQSTTDTPAESFFESEDASGMMNDHQLRIEGPAGSLLSGLDQDWVKRMMAEEWGRFNMDPMEPDAAAALEREILLEVNSVTPGPWLPVSNATGAMEMNGINDMAVSDDSMMEEEAADYVAREAKEAEMALMTHYGNGQYTSSEPPILRSDHKCPVCLKGRLWSAGALFGCDDCNLRMRFKGNMFRPTSLCES
ncbi:hypothetical protein HDU97_007871 [Phlyctochytrium planicorne]|nr:hypothetical protein HDU97_007871 [Phlyctochytrium planicorne]